jgi:CheY-like chemotaxis protein
MKTLLFVDDEPWLQEPLRCALEAKGYKCLWVTDMSSALELLSKAEVSVVVTDIMMPPGNDFPEIDSHETGFHLINRVRAKWPDIPIVCLSVIGDESKLRPLRNSKVNYLRKGEVPLVSVVETIERAAERRPKTWRF